MTHPLHIFRRAVTYRRPAGLVLASFLLTACSGGQEATSASARDDPEMLEHRATQLERKPVTAVPQEEEAPITGEVPEVVLDNVLMALERLSGADRSEFELVRAAAVEWPDGALGCPQPGMEYLQAPVPGYQVVLKHLDRSYDFRAGRTSYVMLCLEPGQAGQSGGLSPKS